MALYDYKQAVNDLQTFCEKETSFVVEIIEREYQMRLRFTPKPQMSLFDLPEQEEDGNITITVGVSTTVTSTMKFNVDAKTLSKLIKLSEAVGETYLHAFRECIEQRLETVFRKISEDCVEVMWELCVKGVEVALFKRSLYNAKVKEATNNILEDIKR